MIATACSIGHAQKIELVKKTADLDAIQPYNYSVPFKGKLYFLNAKGLYVTDGTGGGTLLVKKVNPQGLQPTELNIINNKLLFVYDDGVHGQELWVSDGTEQGTQMLIDLNQGAGWGVPDYQYNYGSRNEAYKLPVLNGEAYFYGNDGSNGIELWKTDGTPGGTVMVRDINSGTDVGIVDSEDVKQIVVLNNKVVFMAATAGEGYELWTSDGTSSGTQMVVDYMPGTSSLYPIHFIVYNNKVIFSAQGVSAIFSYDGSTITKLKDDAEIFRGNDYAIFNNKLYFPYYQSGSSTFDAVGVTDGTPNGTGVLMNMTGLTVPVFADGISYSFTVANGKLFFFGSIGQDQGLWVSDGTQGGTSLLVTGSNTYRIGRTISFGNKAYFRVYDMDNKMCDLWSTDGTSGGTMKLDYSPRTDVSSPIIGNMTAVSNYMLIGTTLYFFNYYNTDDALALYRIGMWPGDIQDQKTGNDINIYPNPVSNSLIIAGDEITYIRIQDISGKTIYDQNQFSSKITINTSSWAPGVYIAGIINKGITTQKKIVKE